VAKKIFIGTGMHQSNSSGNLIMKLEKEARIGQQVADKSGKNIGEIFDVFGPVESPYASVKLRDDVELGKIPGKSVFLGERKYSKKRRRKKRRR
jgi:RNA-binding protein